MEGKKVVFNRDLDNEGKQLTGTIIRYENIGSKNNPDMEYLIAYSCGGYGYHCDYEFTVQNN